MDQLFLIQLLTSFIVGGLATAAGTLIAERVSPRVAGIVLGFPTTCAIGFFFMGWALASEEVVRVVPVAIFALGLSTLFLPAYIYTASLKLPKALSIIVSYAVAIGFWLCLAVPLAIFQFRNLPLALVSFFIMSAMGFFLLARKAHHADAPSVHFTFGQTFARTMFAGCVIALTVYLSKTLESFWGGVFSVFPASWSSGLLILHYHYDASFLLRAYRMAPLGALSILVFVLVVLFAFPPYGFVWGTIIAYLITAVCAWVMLRVMHA